MRTRSRGCLRASRLNDEELVQLLLALAVPLSLGPDRKLALSIHNLTLLYRHATLARCLGLTVSGALPAVRGGRAPAPDRWRSDRALRPRLEAFRHRISSTTSRPCSPGAGGSARAPSSRDEIAFITGGTIVDQATLVSGEKRADPAAVVEAVVTELVADSAFEFADTVLSGMPNGPADDHRGRVAEDRRGEPGALRTPPGQTSYRLKKEISAADITVPGPATEFTVTAAEVAAGLYKALRCRRCLRRRSRRRWTSRSRRPRCCSASATRYST